ncbi:RNA polymerase sigma factor [Sphingobacterium prati]|uniref:RNA polymerase sigma factor n=1 Tax=Sphingobacterium prati TaxID=2737006 RepID=UPI001554F4B6|nr:sigma-70 family RNA polymerase sigma factor [Sphingobacterium prati]NPE48846.1 sigma-70 family RNA polymerase sigma factor [Sphingobacterium prati]
MKNDKYASHNNISLLARLREGDLEAFNILYNRYWSLLLDESYKRLEDLASCEEIVQDVFIDLWEHCSKREILNVEAYLFTCMKYKVFETYKKSKRRNVLIAENKQLYQSQEVVDGNTYGEKDLKSLIEQWVSNLPQKRQEIFKMRYLDGLTTKEISDLTKTSQNTVQNHLGVSIQKLKKLVLQHFLTLLMIFYTCK